MSKVHFILDEAASLGRLECVHSLLGMGRGFGSVLQMYFQSVGQVKAFMPEGQEQTLKANCTQIFMGANDLETAKEVSETCGVKTVEVASGGTSSGTSRGLSFGRDRGSNTGSSTNRNSNWNQQTRKLFTEDEVRAAPDRAAFVFVPCMRPIYTPRLLRHYEENFCPGRLRRFCASLFSLVRAAALCAITLTIAGALTKAIGTKARPPVPVNQGIHLFKE